MNFRHNFRALHVAVFTVTMLLSQITSAQNTKIPSLRFRGSGIEAAGCQNVVAVHPTIKELLWRIDGYRDEKTGRDVLYIGIGDVNTAPYVDPATGKNSGWFKNIMRSKNGGANWETLTSGENRVHAEMNETGAPFWLAVGSLNASRTVLGKKAASFRKSSLIVKINSEFSSPDGSRSGVHSTAGQNFYPIVSGMGTTFNRFILADPNAAGKVFVANTDWVYMFSTDALKSISDNPPPNKERNYNMATGLAYDGKTLFIAGGNRDDNEGGDIFSNAQPTDKKASWTDEGLRRKVGEARVLAVAVGKNAEGERVLLTVVNESTVQSYRIIYIFSKH